MSTDNATTTTPEEPKDDLMDLNADAETINEDGSLIQENEEEFKPGDYGGFPMEEWNRYFGAINDKKQTRQAKLANFTKYKVRYNVAPDTMPYPDFKLLELTYYPITKKVWEQRRKDLAEVTDLERQINAQALKLAESQESLRLRIFNRNKPRGMITNRDDPTKAALEEIQTNMKFYADVQSDISKKLAEKKQETDAKAFQMYFHKDKNTYEQTMNEDLDDILAACDFKQIHGSANLRLSKALSTPSPSAGTA
jgi:hypothetical protein